MSVDTRQRLTTGFGQKRSSFRDWRGQRPFWGGMLTLLAGIPIMYVPYQNLTLGSLTIRMSTTAGAGSLIIGVLLVVLGLTMWFQPHSRVFAGVAAILLALVSLVVSNFGAFLIGFLPGMVGGALGLSWAPGKAVKTPAEPAGTTASKGPAAAGPVASVGPADAAAPDDDPAMDEGEGPRDNTAVSGAASSKGADANDGNGRHRAG
ncbi:DUF6114 domain-containing protein [Streptomyces sp. NBC_01795]|uniref:DUF6114 domain-containing protein n=1 Tax=unclassified Streptomyces TaxID=2593676 RepID=UPI002DDC7FA4|nr:MULTISPECIES: DUF6114 domain-containing protein [unclassified Streptomyces]WSA92278.1 DUF6114 domain-containing protein [Streptomyces sp. NBC_01795]WSB76647.1 DUF6114 domain-containing protein [Streptomyces sp. NBC_01775]WSS15066.1 DUF6114 domain-containing protein [Streptomyces sp. NBC_01186]